MKTLTVISGKGGTGKTTIVSAIHDLIDHAITADCDVDAPNLHLLLEGEPILTADFWGANEAKIDSNRCIECGKCLQACRFGAIGEDFTVSSLLCEGCGACRVVCPAHAVSLGPVVTGTLTLDRTQRGLFAHALLKCGAEGSGKLVTEVRQMGEKNRTNEDWMVIDGAPGIGCAVIASISGADMAVIVTEPTLSGLSDLERILGTTAHFDVPSVVCINKADINGAMSGEIEDFCKESNIPVIGKIPFDKGIYDCLQKKQPLSSYNGPAAVEIRKMWSEIKKRMEGDHVG